MPRYSLRNKDKISDVLGKDFLNCLLISLEKTFKNKTIKEYKNDKYNIIHSDNYEFYVISKTYDVFNLAFKGEIK